MACVKREKRDGVREMVCEERDGVRRGEMVCEERDGVRGERWCERRDCV